MPRLGCSTRLAVTILIILVALSVAGGLLGAIVNSVLGLTPAVLSVARPHPQLPPEVLWEPFSGFKITNTVLGAWVSIIVLGLLAFVATRRMRLVPGRLQAFAEMVVETLLNFVEGIAGRENGRRFFPIVATIFLFVIANAWLSLVPGFISLTWRAAPGETVHLLRGANTDLNLPLALALISFVFVEYWGMSSLGVFRYLRRFFNFGALFHALGHLFRGRLRRGVSGLVNGAIAVFVGALEGMSELVRIISFTFRLFGNMTAGEILLLLGAYLFMFGLANMFFYSLELLVGFVQALIFAGLTLVFATIAITPHGEHQ
ncbi:MAG TPA: F0F1 ATP synthase subunit A [Dehalococcoidia bacterium]|nr:F0F1 ATP synthase subunit A [Dehalococcoidia bacterium]